MATVPTRPVRRDADPVTPDPGAVRYQEDIVRSPILRGLLTFARLLIGWTFMWPFLDKLFGLGFATPSERAWVNGGMPSQGFMKNTTGPFADLFKNMAGTWTDWLFMAGLFGIGLAMLLGAGLKIAAWSGTLLLFLMYLAEFPLGQPADFHAVNPITDSHWHEATLLLLCAYGLAGDTFGLGRWWGRKVGNGILR
ncbi:DoxX family protein [Nostocoides veronense]|uniref:DoxX family membrane protein n=1 Tax=Nostocoides veronense TaxID=330836 RepID=A0ABP4XNB9_9MICO